MKSILKYLFMFAFGVSENLMAGYVLSKYWGWFVINAFAAAPALTYMRACGLLFTFNLLLMGLHMKGWSDVWNAKKPDPNEPDFATKSIYKSLAMCIFVYPTSLLAAYCWHQFIQ